jgi:Spy/CpxP family protein refolding chaperone
MKTVLLAMFTIASFSAMAQEVPHHGPRHSAESFTPEQAATLQTKRMILALDLTDLQQEQVREFHLENARLRQQKMETHRAEESEKHNTDLSAEERFRRANDRLDHMIAQKEKMKVILSPEQYEKWEEYMHHKKGHHLKAGRERHGRR